MARFSRLAFVAAVGATVLLLCSWGAARAQQGATLTVSPSRAQAYSYSALPGYWMLRSESVQKELELVDEQMKEIEEITKKYQQEMRQGNQRDWSKLREMSQEDRNKLLAEFREKRSKQAAAMRKKIEGVLLAHQLDALKAIELRTRAVPMLQNARVAEQLGLSEKQQEKLRQSRDKMTKKVQDLQKEFYKEALDVLTPEQLDKLKKLHTEGYRSVFRRAQPQ